MAVRCLNPWCFQGDPGNPPEYEVENGAICSRCMDEDSPVDVDEWHCVDADGNVICEDCRWKCCDCGEFVGDNRCEVTKLCDYRDEFGFDGDYYCRYCFALELCGGLEG